ncbi:MAG: hypothetical protein HOE90_13375 [Bacteriovoracaceae bacterium]|nr:hypothetical protein [Bacteriovoracaceae bacterium]
MELTRFLLVLVFCFSGNVFSSELEFKNLQLNPTTAQSRNIASSGSSSGIFSTTNLAWTTMTFIAATALTGKEKTATSTHLSLASLAGLSYGAFIHSYFNDDEAKSHTVAGWSKWFHIPAMVLLPIAGAVAQRQFDKKGKNSASGIGSIHKPAALAAVVAMSLTALSLTFEF